jgi:hypothetical protein
MFRPICCKLVGFFRHSLKFFVNVSQNEWKYLQKNFMDCKIKCLLLLRRLFNESNSQIIHV